MKKLIKLLIVISSLIMLSCGLDRSNPLDPAGSHINTPKKVTGIDLSSSGQGAIDKFVVISWTPLPEGDANGYFIYRSRSYDGTFDLIAEIRNREESLYTDNYKIVTGPYFYKMSAFVYLDEDNPNDNERLEGPLNRPGKAGIVVPQ